MYFLASDVIIQHGRGEDQEALSIKLICNFIFNKQSFFTIFNIIFIYNYIFHPSIFYESSINDPRNVD
jgi:hypothetical protein